MPKSMSLKLHKGLLVCTKRGKQVDEIISFTKYLITMKFGDKYGKSFSYEQWLDTFKYIDA